MVCIRAGKPGPPPRAGRNGGTRLSLRADPRRHPSNVVDFAPPVGDTGDMPTNKRSGAAPINPGPRNTVHVRCGSDILERLMEAGLPGTAIEWSDPVSQGPLPATDDPRAFTAARARFLATDYRLNEAKVLDALSASDDALDDAVQEAEEIVLWFEHDLYDQAVLVRLLTRIAAGTADRLTIVTLDSHPSVERFVGLGQLSEDALAALYDQRKPVDPMAPGAAARVWRAMRSDDPSDVEAALEGDLPGLPYLRPAMRRYLADYPGLDDGLAETERLILGALADGARTPGAIFRHLHHAETAPWMGDLMLWPWIVRLATAPSPALELQRPLADGPFDGKFVRQRLRLTPFGQRLLGGTAHWLEINGIERWIGGVAPKGVAAWRWERRATRLIPVQ